MNLNGKCLLCISNIPCGQFKREGTYVNLWLIHVDVWQELTQYCKAVIIQLKVKKKKRMSLELAGNPQERSLTEKSRLKS